MNAAEEKYRILFEKARDGIVIMDPETGAISEVNPAFCLLTGYDCSELIGKTIWELRPENYQALSRELFYQVVGSGEGESRELPLQRKDGSLVHAEFLAVRVEYGGRQYIHSTYRDITAKRKIAAQLDETQRHYQLLFEEATDAIAVLNLKGVIMEANHRLANLVGIPIESVIGRNIHELMHLTVQTAGFDDQVAKVIAQGGMEFEVSFPRGNETVWVEIRAQFIPAEPEGMIQCYIQDITAERRLTKEREGLLHSLALSEEKYRHLADNIPTVIYSMQPGESLALSFINPYIKRFSGLPPEDFYRNALNAWERCLHPEDKDRVLTHKRQAATKGARYRMEYRLLNLEGQEFTVVDQAIPVWDKSGQLVRLDGFIHDLTPRVRLEEELHRRRLLLEEKNRDLRDVLHMISHDLNTPLISIMGFLTHLKEELKKTALTEKENLYMERISANVEKMGRLIRDLLELSRAERMDGHLNQVDPNHIVSDILVALEEKLAARGVKVLFHHDLPLCMGSPVRLSQVFTNLLDNAINYMGEQVQPQIEIGGKKEGSRMLYWIKDNGMGIPQEYQDMIFNYFQRVPQDTPVEGTGLGLSIVKKIISNHAGKIWVKSAPGEGSTFYFTLPSPEKTEADSLF